MNIERWHQKLFLVDMRRAIETYGLIRPGDRILIGISGGKDSMTLGIGLELLKRWLPIPYETGWVHLDYGAGGDPEPLKQWLAARGIPLQVVPTDIWPSVEGRAGGSPCYLCAKLRRGILARIMEAQGFTSMALGHHQDDALATLWMNLQYNGRYRTFKPLSVEAETGRATIRPMILCREDKIRLAAERFGYPQAPWHCPNDADTERGRTEAWLETLKKAQPGLDQQMIHALQHLSDEDRW